MTAREVCAACGGDGYYKGPRLGDEPCPQCKGEGVLPSPVPVTPKAEPPTGDWPWCDYCRSYHSPSMHGLAEPPTAREVIEADRRRQSYERHPTLKPAEPDAVPGWCREAMTDVQAMCNLPPSDIPEGSRLIHEAWKRSEEARRLRSVCTYCGHIEESEDEEARFSRMCDHILACEKHPLREVPKLLAAKEAAEARVERLELRVFDLGHALALIAAIRCGIPGHSVAVGCKAASIARATLAETQGGEEGR